MLEKLAVAEAVTADNTSKSYITGGAKVGFNSAHYNLFWLVEKGLIFIEHKGTKNYTVTTVANARELKPLKVQKIPDYRTNDMCEPVKALLENNHSSSLDSTVGSINKKLDNALVIMGKTNKLLAARIPNP